ncbi:MAG: hypothetical protein M3R15_11550 [Acidobacteriota bacterium]|nr:hypothetical protein [Acidobacteriota bacterium]
MNLREKTEATQAWSTFQRLNELDDLWTDFLAQARRITARDTEHLRALTKEMNLLLTRSAQHATSLSPLLGREAATIDQTFQSVIESARLTRAQKSKIQAKVTQAGGFAAFARAACKGIAEGGTAAKKELKAKMTIIESGGFTPGDLRKIVKCFLASAAAGAAFGAGQVAAGTAIILKMVDWGCFD